MEITQLEVDEVVQSLTGLREDQQRAMTCLGELICEIKASPEPLAFGVFWIGEKDLLGDAPMTWISNLSRGEIKKQITHFYKRLTKDDPPESAD